MALYDSYRQAGFRVCSELGLVRFKEVSEEHFGGNHSVLFSVMDGRLRGAAPPFPSPVVNLGGYDLYFSKAEIDQWVERKKEYRDTKRKDIEQRATIDLEQRSEAEKQAYLSGYDDGANMLLTRLQKVMKEVEELLACLKK